MSVRRALVALALALAPVGLGAGVPAGAVEGRTAAVAQAEPTTTVAPPPGQAGPTPADEAPASSGGVLVVGALVMTGIAIGFGVWLRRREG